MTGRSLPRVLGFGLAGIVGLAPLTAEGAPPATAAAVPAVPAVRAVPAEQRATPAAAARVLAVAYQGNARHTGHVVGGVAAPPLQRRWMRNLGGPVSYPLLAEGKVVVTVALPSGGTALRVLDARTGRDVRRPVALGGRYRWSAAAYGDGRVYVVTDQGLMRAYSLRSGALQWRRQLPRQWAFSAAPTFYAGSVYTGGSGVGGTLYAVDARTGRLGWARTVATGAGSSPAVTSTGVYVAYVARQVYRFHPRTGRLLWHNDEGEVGGDGATPIITTGGLWVPADSSRPESFIDLSTGRVKTSAPSRVLNQPAAAFAGRVGYVVRRGRLVSVATSSPWQARWTFAPDRALVTAPLVVDGVVYVASASGRLWAVDVETGRPVWATNLGTALTWPDQDAVGRPLPGLAAGQGHLVVPAGNRLFLFS